MRYVFNSLNAYKSHNKYGEYRAYRAYRHKSKRGVLARFLIGHSRNTRTDGHYEGYGHSARGYSTRIKRDSEGFLWNEEGERDNSTVAYKKDVFDFYIENYSQYRYNEEHAKSYGNSQNEHKFLRGVACQNVQVGFTHCYKHAYDQRY